MKLLPSGMQLEQWFSTQGLKAVERFTFRGFDVYIGEGGPHHDAPHEHPHGYYESAYAVGVNGKIAFFQPMAFSADHDLGYSEAARRQGRINAARQAARAHLEEANRMLNGETVYPS